MAGEKAVCQGDRGPFNVFGYFGQKNERWERHVIGLPSWVDGPLQPAGKFVLVVSTASVGLATPPAGAVLALVSIRLADISYLDTGDAVTTANGLFGEDGVTLVIEGASLSNFRAIRNAAVDAELRGVYYGPVKIA